MQKFKILIVEDELKQIKGTVRGITYSDTKIELAHCKREAESFLKKKKFDFVIMDLRIPEKPHSKPDYGVILGLDVIKDMFSGKLGNINVNTKFIIVTAQKRSHGLNANLGEHCLGVFGKLKIFDVLEIINEQIRVWRERNE